MNSTISFIDVADDGGAGTVAQLTLANGTSAGQRKVLAINSIATGGDLAEVKLTFFDSSGNTISGASSEFNSAGQSANLIWTGSAWMNINGGATVNASASF